VSWQGHHVQKQRLTTQRNPDSVVVEDATEASEGSGTNTPAGEPDDFFSSWDKPSIKRPSNPPSRSNTPGIGRTASPFLAPNGNGQARSKSPLTPAEPAAPRTTSTAALRKTATSKPKSSILGAKKNKLGAKKVDASALDFDEAEKKAREEAERKERLGYDPDEEVAPAEVKLVAAQPESSTTTLHMPTPMNPPRPKGDYGSGSAANRQRETDAEMERLGMGVRKLGFGQVGGGAKTAAPKAKTMGFGSTTRAPVEGKQNDKTIFQKHITNSHPLTDDSQRYAREKFGVQKGISSDEFFSKGAYDPSAQSEAKTRLQGFEGAQSISSNAYFGRPEDEEGVEDYGDLETAAKDFVRKFGITAGDDLENLSSMLGDGATKLQGAIRNYLNN
jgi:ADP-ribosylation factor GTPase-activating protein 2/3